MKKTNPNKPNLFASGGFKVEAQRRSLRVSFPESSTRGPNKANPPALVLGLKIKVLRLLIQRFFASQDMMVVLCEPVGFVSNVL